MAKKPEDPKQLSQRELDDELDERAEADKTETPRFKALYEEWERRDE